MSKTLAMLFLTAEVALGGTGVALGGGGSPPDPTQLTLTQAAEQIRARTLTSEQLVRALLARIDRSTQLNAFITLDREGALAAARRADEQTAQGGTLPPLHGVPLVFKDNIDVMGLPTSGGTAALRTATARRSAPVVAALMDAGAIVLGKTNLHELAFGITSDNATFGSVRNPYDLTRFAGGSSGGTAAALAARLAPGGLGTDTGGSVRIPAALTGTVGLRPTVGRYSQAGIVPLSNTRDTAGPMARTVEDVALLDALITGENVTLQAAPLRGLRLGVPRAYFYDDLDPETSRVIEAALSRLEAAGAVLVPVELPGLAELNARIGFPVVLYEVLRTLPAYLKASGSGVTLDNVVAGIRSPDVVGAFAVALGPDGQPGTADDAISQQVYQGAIQEARPALQALYRQTFANFKIEALIFPTTPAPAQPIQGSAEKVMVGGRAVPTFNTFIRNTDPSSNAGLPGLSLPAGLTAQGLPVGLELDGPAGSDRRLLAIGAALFKVLGPVTVPQLP